MVQKISSDILLYALKAAGEPTRLRLLALLRHGELNVKDLTRILGQSQPRISRHLKLLGEAGLIEPFREGSWKFFRLRRTGQGAALLQHILAEFDDSDPLFMRDSERALEVKADRAQAAQDYFRTHAEEWDKIRALHIAEEQVEQAMLTVLGNGPFNFFIDVGTGTGRILELFSGRFTQGLGIDINTDMLALARANLESAGIKGCQVRQGDLYHLPRDTGSADAVVIHQVLHFLESPALALAECARVLAPGGRLLIVDFAAHELDFLREKFAHQRLGFSGQQIEDWAHDAGLKLLAQTDLVPNSAIDGSGANLTVSLWLVEKSTKRKLATRHEDQPVRTQNLEDAA